MDKVPGNYHAGASRASHGEGYMINMARGVDIRAAILPSGPGYHP